VLRWDWCREGATPFGTPDRLGEQFPQRLRGMSRICAAGTGKLKPSKVGRNERDRRLLGGTPSLLGVCFFVDALRVALLEEFGIVFLKRVTSTWKRIGDRA
jgi:hypothetical protein